MGIMQLLPTQSAKPSVALTFSFQLSAPPFSIS